LRSFADGGSDLYYIGKTATCRQYYNIQLDGLAECAMCVIAAGMLGLLVCVINMLDDDISSVACVIIEPRRL